MVRSEPYWKGTIILGLAGRKKTGKDTAADYLVEKYSGVVKINFSDQIIKELDTMLAAQGLSVDLENKEPFRPLLQEWGEFRRSQDEDYWIQQTGNLVDQAVKDKKKLILVCGPRSIPEFEMVHIRGGELWKIIRPALEAEQKMEESTNITEEILDRYSKFDRYLLNDSSMERFYEKVDKTLSELVERHEQKKAHPEESDEIAAILRQQGE